MSEQQQGTTNKTESSDPAAAAASEAGAAPAAPAPITAAELKAGARAVAAVVPPVPKAFVKCIAEAYRGMDQGTGEFLNLADGDVAQVSIEKAEQVLRDFPNEFEQATAEQFRKAEASRAGRARAKAEAVKKREEAQAQKERRRAIDDDDLE
jgi:hypothetical protein